MIEKENESSRISVAEMAEELWRKARPYMECEVVCVSVI